MTNREFTQAANALVDWFRSQDISAGDAAYLMAMLIGEIVKDTSSNINERLEGIEILRSAMVKQAHRK